MSFVYSDVKSDLNVTERGTVEVLHDEAVILQSLRNIFATVTGERVRNPIGCALIRILFEPMNDMTVRDIKYELTRSINLFEPRVSIIKISVRPDYDNNLYDVDMEMSIKKLDKRVFFSRRLRSMSAM